LVNVTPGDHATSKFEEMPTVSRDVGAPGNLPGVQPRRL
jgi:hypothetical protein